jgi:hypothetical protein
MVSAFHLRVPPGLRLSISSLPIELKREQIINLMSGSLHSTSTIILSIALLMVSHQKIGVKRINRMVDHNATRVSIISYRLNAQSK